MRGRGLVIGVTVVLLGLAAGAAYVTRDTALPLENAPALKVSEALGGRGRSEAG